MSGQATCYPRGCCYLRFRQGRKIGWWRRLALIALRNKEHLLRQEALGHEASVGIAGAPAASVAALRPISTLDAIGAYLEEVRRFRSPKTIQACERILGVFGARFGAMDLVAITRKDLLDHTFELKKSGLSDRTIYNHMMRIGTQLKANGIAGLLSKGDKPQYEEKDVEAYNSDQLQTMFAAADPDERLLFEFFLGTGLREREVMYTTWKNIDFKSKVVAVRSKPECAFKIKDKEERSVPVPDSLIEALMLRKKHSTTSLLFPTPEGHPNGHFLRILKNLAFRARLNYGECVSKAGEPVWSIPFAGTGAYTSSAEPSRPFTVGPARQHQRSSGGWDMQI